MENDTTVPKEGLLEPVPPGSVTFDDNILVALRNSYLYEESKERFTYSSAHLIKNTCLQKRYSDFRAEKRANGYAEEELDESFGFLLFEAESRANELADTGLIVGQNTCTTLGDSSKGVYVCKYSDCLDEKLWYDGKTGYIVILKLTKGRVKEVTENYTQNFTPPTVGFDCHVSEHLSAVCATTSSFLAFERTRYFMYELLHVGGKLESCPRHVCPYAVVAFSYGKTSLSLELKDKGHGKSSFHYQPWSGKLQIKSHLFDVGLKSVHGAMFPAHLPKTVQVDHAIGVSELRKTLPQAVFETSLVGEVSLDGQCFNLYDVAFFEAKEEISLLINELKEKDMALVISLDDRGFLILLHSSHFLSYEGSGTDKSSALQGMFIFPNTRTVPKETKTGQTQKKVPPEVFQVLPALNYAESEMEKCPPNQNVEPVGVLEKHLENFAALICPGLSSSPTREASMFPDQYDVPDGFPLMAPKWTENAGTRLQSYLEKPCSFQIPLSRALEILAAGKQQRSDDHDDDVCYYISSPEEIQQSPTVESESIATEEDGCVNVSSLALDEQKHTEQQAEKQKALSVELSHDAFLGEASTPGTVVVATADNSFERKEPSPRSGDLPTEHLDNCKANSESTSQHVTVNKCIEGLEKVLKETQFSSEPVISSTENGSSSSRHIEVESLKNTHCNSQVPRSEDQTSFVRSDISKEAGLPMSISPHTPSECSGIPQTRRNLNISRRHGRRKRRGLKRHPKRRLTPPLAGNTMSQQTGTLCEQRESEVVHSSPCSLANKDWRSLPRQKRQWKADVAVKRVLRSDAKTSETEALEKSPASTELNVTEKRITSTPKRKAEGISMRERYGLKTIITDCGKVFVPHGSEVSSEGVVSLEKKPRKTNSEKVEATQSLTTESLVSSTERNWLETVKRKGELHSKEDSEGQDSSSVTTKSPSKEWPSVLSLLHTPASDAKHPPAEMETKAQPMPLTHIQNKSGITPPKAVSSQAQKDVTSCTSSDPPLDSSEKSKSKAKSTVYKAISISKLKTVLRRAKRTVSPDKAGDGKLSPESADPVLKKSIANSDVENCKQSLSTDAQDHSSAVQHDAESTGSQDPGEHRQSKQISLSWRELGSSPSQEKLMSDSTKENGCIRFDTPASHELVKQADQQLISTLRGNRAGGKNVCGKDGFPTGVSLPSDALNLLADLALGANSEKSLANLRSMPSQETHGVKSFSTPSSVLHTLLRGSSAKLKLPPKSASPERLVATGNLILEISKEHSYSQPTSLLLGLAGANPQLPPPISIESLLSLKAGVHLKLPDRTSDSVSPYKGGKMGGRLLGSLDPTVSSAPKSRMRKPKFLRHRCVVEEEGSIQVTRSWEEMYDFKFDSKFTNDCLDKTVTRALHGKWDFGIEDTYEQVHLILHMWIGLFYSKHISRLFHFDHNIPRKDAPLEKTEKSVSPVQADTSRVDADLSSEKDKTSSLPRAADALDLSVKTPGSVEHDDVIIERDEKKLAPNSVIKPSLECTLANKEPARTQTSASVVKQLRFLSYRDTSDILDTCSVPENDDNSDPENDTTDSAYTEDLEKNCEYSHLCEKASHMCIDKQKSLKMLKRYRPEAVPIKSVGKINFGPKAVTIFHKVVDSLRPLNISEAHGQASGRKIILKSLCFKDKPADGTAASVCTENRPKAEDCAAATLNKENNNSAPMIDCPENEKDDSELKIESVKDSTCTLPVCESKGTDNTSVDVHDDKDKEVEETNPVGCDIRDDTCVAQGDKETDSPMLDVRYEMSEVGDDMSVPDVKNETSSELHDMNNDEECNDVAIDVVDNSTTCASQRDSLVEMQNEEHEDDVEDEVPVCEAGCNVFEHDESNETEGECDDNEKVEVKMPLDVTDNTSAKSQEVTDEAKDEVHEVHLLHSVHKADADDENESVRAYEVENVEGVRNQEVIQAHDLKEQSFEKNKSTASKEITEECDESEISGGARPICDENTETDGGEQNDGSDLKKDDGDSVDMDICEENDSEDDTQGKMLKVNVACGDTLEQITDDEELVKPHEVEIRSKASVVSMDKEHTKDDAQAEVAKDFSPDKVKSTVNSFVTLKEGPTSPAKACTYSPAEDNCESTKLDNSVVVQVKASEISVVKPVRVGGDLSPVSVIADQEPGEVDDSALHDSTTYDVVDLNTSVMQSSDSSFLETQKKVTDHKRASSKICEMSAETQDYHNQSVLSTALEIGTHSEAYSRSCTPTQDELPYNEAVCEEIHESGGLQDNHDFYRDLSPVNSSPPDTQYGTDPDRSASLHTEEYVDKHLSNFSHYRARFFSQDPSWSENMSVETKSSLTDEYVPKRYLLHFDQDAIPPSRDSTSKKNSLRKDLLEPADRSFFSKQFDKNLSETSLSRARPGLKTGAPNKLRELCSYDDDEDDDDDSESCFPHFKSHRFVQKGLAHMPEKTETNDWAQHVDYTDSVFTLDEKIERDFHCRPTDLYRDHSRKKYPSNEESESHETDSTSHSRKKPKNSVCRARSKKDFDGDMDYNIRKTVSCLLDQAQMSKTHTSTEYQHTKPFDWRRYFRREGVFDTNEEKDPPSSIVTVFDCKGHRAIYESPSVLKQSVDTCSMSRTVEDFHRLEGQPLKSNITQSLIEHEYLTFSEKLNHMLRNCKDSSQDRSQRLNPAENPMTIQFSRLEEDDGYTALEETWPTLNKFKISVEMPDRKARGESVKRGKPLHLQSLLCDRVTKAASSRIADVTKECSTSYNTMMDDVCSGKAVPQCSGTIKRKRDLKSASGNKRSRFCSHIKKDLRSCIARLHDGLNSIVRQACRTKYEFFIMATSSDPLFDTTKELLEEEGHTAVEPYQFDFDASNKTPLLIILRNEDIAEVMCEVPYLLELKKSPRVLFAGIDQPDDVINLTHQELFAKGGFVVFDETTLDQLSLENMKNVVSTLEELDKKGKWKWFLHYKDSRKFRENARFSPDAQKRKNFIDCCQEAGLLEVLPYHECDVISRDRPDYLRCLICLQIQYASVRFPVFISDAPADSFDRNGILIMNISTFTQIL